MKDGIFPESGRESAVNKHGSDTLVKRANAAFRDPVGSMFRGAGEFNPNAVVVEFSENALCVKDGVDPKPETTHRDLGRDAGEPGASGPKKVIVCESRSKDGEPITTKFVDESEAVPIAVAAGLLDADGIHVVKLMWCRGAPWTRNPLVYRCFADFSHGAGDTAVGWRRRVSGSRLAEGRCGSAKLSRAKMTMDMGESGRGGQSHQGRRGRHRGNRRKGPR